MAIYAATLPGRRKRVLVKADNQTDALKRFVSVEILTAEKMQDALDNGEAVWREGTEFPADDEPEQVAEQVAQESE